MNRRVIYNRASVDLRGQPWDPKRPLLGWNTDTVDAKTGKQGVWTGDIPDGPAPPMGSDGKYPFIMKTDGVVSIFGPGLADGPFPEHYESLECPLEENLMSKQRINPAVNLSIQEEVGIDLAKFFSCDLRYPFVATTYRVSEHWQTGVMTRHQPWQLEMVPQVFVEMSIELAKELGIRNGDKAQVSSACGELWAINDRQAPNFTGRPCRSMARRPGFPLQASARKVTVPFSMSDLT